MSPGRTTLRPVGLLGLAWGALLLWRGPQLFGAVQRRRPSRGERDALVVLGVRHAGQGLVQVLVPHHLAGLYAAIDGLHATSMVAFALTQPQRRRAVLVSGAVAVLAGAASLRARTS